MRSKYINLGKVLSGKYHKAKTIRKASLKKELASRVFAKNCERTMTNL